MIFVFTTKYRKKVLTPQIEKRLKELIQHIAIKKGVSVQYIVNTYQ
ncbi:transposase [Persephonella sp.]